MAGDEIFRQLGQLVEPNPKENSGRVGPELSTENHYECVCACTQLRGMRGSE